jgi:hypothetical protein
MNTRGKSKRRPDPREATSGGRRSGVGRINRLVDWGVGGNMSRN